MGVSGGGQWESRGGLTDRRAGPRPYALCEGTEVSLLYFLHLNFSLHRYPHSVGDEVLS